MNRVKLVLAVVLMFNLMGPMAAVAAIGPEALDIDKLPECEVINSSQGGKLLLSDSPEMVTEDGILYQDKVEGKVRLFFYHVNATNTAKQMEVILENNGPGVAHVTVRQYGMGGPGYDWIAVGKEGVTSYLAGSQGYLIKVPARGSASLSANISDTAVLPNMLVNGIFDFTVDRPVTVKVMQLPILADSGEFSRKAKILPADEVHLRGTFEGANRRIVPIKIYDPLRDGAVALTLADNEIDPYLEGIDATDGSKVVNYGNYGVVYQIILPSKKGGKISCYLTPQGGDYAGAIGIQYRNVDQRLVPTPLGRTFFGGDPATNEFAFLGVFDSNESLSFTFSPPGASNLPVKLVILPQ